MERDTGNEATARRALSSFTTSVGLALGELLVFIGRPEELLEHLRAIHISARATLMASDIEQQRGVIRRPGISLSVAALGVVSAWQKEPYNAILVGEAVALLEEVLEEMGVRNVRPKRPDEY